MKKLYTIFALLLIASFTLSACAPVATEAPSAGATEAPTEVTTEVPTDVSAPTDAAPTAEVTDEPVAAGVWDQDYITEVEPIMMMDPYFIIFGHSPVAVPYYYEQAVKLAGHSCGATTGAWTITKKALEVLYPDGEVPVRGQIAVEAPGAEDEWFVGVFGEIISFITGAAPKTGFIGAEFGETNDIFVRQDKMDYMDEPSGTMPPKMEWVFTRLDTGKKVGVVFNLAVVTPVASDDRKAMGAKMAKGEATQAEADDYYEYWNDRAKFVLDNADMEGFFTVTVHDEGTASTHNPVLPDKIDLPTGEFAWAQPYITDVAPIMMIDPFFQIFGQSQDAVPYYYEEAVKLAGHSCGAISGAWTITKKALEILYPDGEIPVRGQISVEAPGAENEWFVGVFGEVITYITGASPHTGFTGVEFGQANDLFVRRNKMVYTTEPTKQLPPFREWIFTRIDTGKKVGIRFNLVIILPIPTPGRVAMGKTMAMGEASADDAADYIEYWNDRTKFVFEHADMDGFFIVKIYD